GFCLELAGFGSSVNGHRLGNLAGLEDDINALCFFSMNDNVLDGLLFEAAQLGCNRISARWQLSDSIEAFAAGSRSLLLAGFLVGDGQGGAGDDGPGLICNGSLNAGLELGECGSDKTE